MAEKKEWFQKGKEGTERSKTEDAAAKKRRAEGGKIQRFYLKGDTSAKITFLDNPAFFFHEHNLNMNGKWFNYFTCIKDFDTCPICESGDSAGYVLAATVIDHSTWKDDQGEQQGHRKRLFIAKGKARQLILRRIESQGKDGEPGDLTGCVFECARGSSPTECSTGEDIQFLAKLPNLSSLLKYAPKDAKDYLEPIDYAKLLAPMTPKKLREVVGAPSPVGSDGDKTGAEPDEPEEKLDDGAQSIDDLL